MPAASVCIATTCMTNTIPVDAHAAATRSIASAISTGPAPAPPKRSGTPIPSMPAAASSSIDSRGKRPSRSTRSALAAIASTVSRLRAGVSIATGVSSVGGPLDPRAKPRRLR
jgi:hypothetical protein